MNSNLFFFVVFSLILFFSQLLGLGGVTESIFFSLTLGVAIFFVGKKISDSSSLQAPEGKYFNNLLQTLFLSSLGLLAFYSIFSQAIFSFDLSAFSLGSILLDSLGDMRYAMVILAISLGSLLFYMNRDKNFSALVFEGESNKKNNILFGLGILGILLGALSIFSINTSSLSFEDDEFFTVRVAKNLHETGELYQWDFINNIPGQDSELCAQKDYCNYTRSYLYTHLVAFSYNIFGVSEFSTRLPGVLLYFISMLALVSFFIFHGVKKGAIVIIVLTAFLSPVVFSNFFIARMYSLLLFSTLLTYLLTISTFFHIYNNKISTTHLFIYFALLISMIFIGINSHINYILLLGLFLFSIALLYSRTLKKGAKYFLLLSQLQKLAIMILGIILIIFFINELNIISRFQNFITFRIDPGYYARYFTYILDSGLGGFQISLLGFVLAGLFASFQIKRKRINILFVLPFLITLFSVFLFVYFLDTKLFISNRYVAHITLIASIPIGLSLYILGNFLNNRQKKIYFGLFAIIFIFSSIQLFNNQIETRKTFANYNLGYSQLLKSLNRDTDILIGIPIRDYYLPNTNKILRINASQRFNDYDFKKFQSDLEKYSDKNIYFLYTDIKSFHVHSEIRNYLSEYGKIFSHEGNVTIYKVK